MAPFRHPRPKTSQTRPSRDRRRCGLAPLELTLSLPIMLFVMGLMIIVGTTASWKVRTVTTSRQAVWRTLDPRQGHDDPNSRGWPTDARMEIESGQSPIEFDPYTEHDVVRGQPLTAPSGERLEVRESLFDIQDGLTLGVGEIQRRFPVMANMPPGQIHLLREHPILSDRWQFREMGLTSNAERRITFLYPADYERSLSNLVQRFHESALSIVNNPNQPDLETLDNDVELRNPRPGGMEYRPPYGIGRAPDYHIPEGPVRGRLLNPDRVCSSNVFELQSDLQPDIVNATLRLPDRLTRDFLQMYELHLAHIENLLDVYENPMTPREIKAHIAPYVPAMRRDQPVLEDRISVLEDFRDSLQN